MAEIHSVSVANALRQYSLSRGGRVSKIAARSHKMNSYAQLSGGWLKMNLRHWRLFLGASSFSLNSSGRLLSHFW
jgi:hypothetical protein